MWGGVELYLRRVSKWGVLSGNNGGGSGPLYVAKCYRMRFNAARAVIAVLRGRFLTCAGG